MIKNRALILFVILFVAVAGAQIDLSEVMEINGGSYGDITCTAGTCSISAILQECKVIESLADTDDDKPFFMLTAFPTATVQSAACACIGTCTTEATLTFENDDGSVGAITGTVTCQDTTTTPANDPLSGAETSMAQFDVIRFNVTNTPTADDDYIICLNYLVTP